MHGMHDGGRLSAETPIEPYTLLTDASKPITSNLGPKDRTGPRQLAPRLSLTDLNNPI